MRKSKSYILSPKSTLSHQNWRSYCHFSFWVIWHKSAPPPILIHFQCHFQCHIQWFSVPLKVSYSMLISAILSFKCFSDFEVKFSNLLKKHHLLVSFGYSNCSNCLRNTFEVSFSLVFSIRIWFWGQIEKTSNIRRTFFRFCVILTGFLDRAGAIFQFECHERIGFCTATGYRLL